MERPLALVVLNVPILDQLSNHPFGIVDPVVALLGIFANCDLHVFMGCSCVANGRRSRILTHLIVKNLCLVGLRIPDADAGLRCSQVNANNSIAVTHTRGTFSLLKQTIS